MTRQRLRLRQDARLPVTLQSNRTQCYSLQPGTWGKSGANLLKQSCEVIQASTANCAEGQPHFAEGGGQSEGSSGEQRGGSGGVCGGVPRREGQEAHLARRPSSRSKERTSQNRGNSGRGLVADPENETVERKSELKPHRGKTVPDPLPVKSKAELESPRTPALPTAARARKACAASHLLPDTKRCGQSGSSGAQVLPGLEAAGGSPAEPGEAAAQRAFSD